MIPAAAVALPLVASVLDRVLPSPSGLWPLGPSGYAALGAWSALGFMLGELPNSFVKRQLDIAPGETGPGGGRWQLAADRLDSGVGLLLAASLVVHVPVITLDADPRRRTGHPLGLQRADVPSRPQAQARVIPMPSNLLAVEPPPAASTSLTLPLEWATDPGRSGNKACNLARLMAAGLSVPRAIVITNDALEAFLESGGLRGPISDLSRDLPSRSPLDVASAADTIAGARPRERRPDPTARGDRAGSRHARPRTVDRAQLRLRRGW